MEGSPQDKLVSKAQYKNFEAGEFTENRQRSYDETISLIESYPWEQQRDHTAIALTNPSITLEGRQGDYLKLAIYFDGKFVLHYLSPDRKLYTKSLAACTDAYPYLRRFFDPAPFDIAGLKPENTWLQHPASHFTEQDFKYVLKSSVLINVTPPLALLALVSCIMPIIILPFVSGQPPLVILLVMFSFFTILMIRCLALVYNHYRAAKDKMLIISRGSDIFRYGSINDDGNKSSDGSTNTDGSADAPRQFSKGNISDVITYGGRSKGSYLRTTLVRINFKDGTSIELSCLLIQQVKLISKFPGITSKEVTKLFPFIKSSS